MILKKMTNIHTIDSYQLQTKKCKEVKSVKSKSLYIKSFVDDYTMFSNHSTNKKISDLLNWDRINQIHHIKLKTLKLFILSLENMVKDMREIQRLLICFMNLINMGWINKLLYVSQLKFIKLKNNIIILYSYIKRIILFI